MIDFAFADPRLLFPNISESLAHTLDNISTAWFFLSIILAIIGIKKTFKKFGERGWKSAVPIYNTYLLYKYSWSRRAFFVYLASSTLFNVAENASKTLAQSYPNSPGITLIILVAIPLGIIATMCSIIYTIRLAEAFGKGKFFCVGLFLLYPVFIAILGFSKCKYVGPVSIAHRDVVEVDAETKVEVA